MREFFDPTATNDASVVFRLGTTVVTWTDTDADGSAASATQRVTVRDTQAATISVSVPHGELWPASHKMVRLEPAASVSDVCDTAPTVTLDVLSNEFDDGRHRRPLGQRPRAAGVARGRRERPDLHADLDRT